MPLVTDRRASNASQHSGFVVVADAFEPFPQDGFGRRRRRDGDTLRRKFYARVKPQIGGARLFLGYFHALDIYKIYAVKARLSELFARHRVANCIGSGSFSTR